MKIHLRHGDTSFDYERKPMPKDRFLTVCAVVTVGIVAALCGVPGLLVVAGAAAVALLIVMGLK